MKTIFRTMMVTSLRDKITLFYSIALPIGLLVGLGYYVDNESYIPTLLTGVIALSSLFWGVSGIAFQVHWQRSRGVFKLLKLTPYPIIGFIFLLTAARTVLGIAINLIVLLVGITVFHVTVAVSTIFIMLGVKLLGTLCFTLLGYSISNFANNEAQINIISNLFFFPMIFGTDAFYSITNAPDWVVTMGKMFPLGYYVHGLRSALGTSNESIVYSIIILAIYTFALLILAAVTFKWEANSTAIKLKKLKGKSAA
ncbi:ABC transporter permease [Bacillus sp. S/N-304-OC-R1]|uniref:ABC transporter permease n=1 Tax=Bacillus sp. S/N-304-OC-R1 TaxID=2758034 RepID=UPI001C8D069E|nr:ABC transporter permease [Bacillus sp. S/N-304-OC-R1]MBY0121513.1 ABC transporter permease [Bacillus sp. S/N-304-OC-R1]